MSQEIDFNKLLDREPSQINLNDISNLIDGKSILITGASGSIGSELTRKIARFNPKSLTLFDHNENNQFFLEKELKEKYPNIKIIPRIGSIADKDRASVIFEEAKPNIVFHCAALKHVPLCESNVSEAIRTNVLGTHTIAELAANFNCELFCQISTDKSVKPTGCMGCTKRIAEYVVQLLSAKYTATKFIIVRFGNVLGSAGSVVPIFKSQIQENKPITITHPDMTRFFMTISEAVELVLQSSVISKTGETFILDMGQPIKIVDIAKRLINILAPNKQVDIVYTSIRPGEKIHEELTYSNEDVIKTSHEKILKIKSAYPATDTLNKIIELENLSPDTDDLILRKKLMQLVPEATLSTSKT